MAAQILVRFFRRARQERLPKGWRILPTFRGNLCKNHATNANVGKKDLTAERAARVKKMPRLLAEEGDRNVGGGSGSKHLATLTGNARWQVDGKHRYGAHRDPLQRVGVNALNRL